MTEDGFDAIATASCHRVRMSPKSIYCFISVPVILTVMTSCSVVEDAGLFTQGSVFGDTSKSRKTEVTTDSKKASTTPKENTDREAKRAETAKKAAAEAKLVALKTKELEAAKRKLEAKEEQETAAKAAAEKAEREKASLARGKERENAKLAKAEGRRKAAEARALRELEEPATSGGGGGFFSRLSMGTPSKYKSEGHDVFVNQRVLDTLDPANAKIEISLSEQRARIYKQEGAEKVLVIETQVSTGKSGHSTSPGTFKISEKLPTKQSSLYGHWVNANGETVPSSGSADSRPTGGAKFVGAEMPYWMRINGGIGMHIGYVPDHPASHGCIRVPSTIQPLIFAKVGLGTEVTILQ